MKANRNLTAAAVAALALVAGCGDNDPDESPTTSAAVATTTTSAAAATTTAAAATASTTRSADALKAALLTPADLPGTTVATSAQQDFDLSTCIPNNSFATATDPTEVKNPGLELTDGGVQRQYGSKARQGTAEQAKAFVTAFASPAGSTCVVNAFKQSVSANSTPPRIDASGLSGTGTAVAVADGGGLLSLSGQLVVGTDPVFTEADLLVFQKGSVVVFVSASAVAGPKVPGQALSLAQKIAGRLP